jgi:hypothetical protein
MVRFLCGAVMKVYITRWALTKGILEVDGRIDGDYISWGRYGGVYKEGVAWHRDLESALREAERMRQDRIVSLEKQLTKLRRIVSFKLVKVE